jgi:hypothetical protein
VVQFETSGTRNPFASPEYPYLSSGKKAARKDAKEPRTQNRRDEDVFSPTGLVNCTFLVFFASFAPLRLCVFARKKSWRSTAQGTPKLPCRLRELFS